MTIDPDDRVIELNQLPRGAHKYLPVVSTMDVNPISAIMSFPFLSFKLVITASLLISKVLKFAVTGVVPDTTLEPLNPEANCIAFNNAVSSIIVMILL